MTPDVSRACARVKNALNLEPGPQLDELIAAGEAASAPNELPSWALAVLNAQAPDAK